MLAVTAKQMPRLKSQRKANDVIKAEKMAVAFATERYIQPMGDRKNIDDINLEYRGAAFVSGYHEQSYPPPVAYEAGLHERFAVVMDMVLSRVGDGLFDTELFLRIMAAIIGAIKHDSLSIVIDSHNEVGSLSELTDWYDSRDRLDHEPPFEMYLRQGAQLVAMTETEFWAKIGGPDIYHDSYTLSVYTAEGSLGTLRNACEQVCHELGAPVSGFHVGAERKEPFVSWWCLPLKWLGFKVWTPFWGES